MKPTEYGRWSIFLPDVSEGKPAIPHGSLIKVCSAFPLPPPFTPAYTTPLPFTSATPATLSLLALPTFHHQIVPRLCFSKTSLPFFMNFL